MKKGTLPVVTGDNPVSHTFASTWLLTNNLCALSWYPVTKQKRYNAPGDMPLSDHNILLNNGWQFGTEFGVTPLGPYHLMIAGSIVHCPNLHLLLDSKGHYLALNIDDDALGDGL
jgi:hypothetical protein